jgi:hypothetical protein
MILENDFRSKIAWNFSLNQFFTPPQISPNKRYIHHGLSLLELIWSSICYLSNRFNLLLWESCHLAIYWFLIFLSFYYGRSFSLCMEYCRMRSNSKPISNGEIWLFIDDWECFELKITENTFWDCVVIGNFLYGGNSVRGWQSVAGTYVSCKKYRSVWFVIMLSFIFSLIGFILFCHLKKDMFLPLW